MDVDTARREAGCDRLLIRALFVAGLALSTAMVLRSQPGGDAVRLLTKGWLLAREGIWIHFGNEASGGGFVPGSLSALLTGLPMLVWLDHRAPAFGVLGFHVLAYVLLDRVVREALGQRARLVLAVVYWLNSWRIYQSAWVDNSNYVFLTGAIHLWALWRQRLRPRLWPSTVLVASVALTAQLHLDALILASAAALLWMRGYWKPHWGGVTLGVAVAVLSLIPYALVAARDPSLLPLAASEDEGFLGRGFVTVWPLFKGLSYWLRYAALGGSRLDMLHFDFAPTFGPAAGALLDRGARWLVYVGSALTLVVALVANLRSWRRLHRARRAPASGMSPRTWLAGYALWTLAGCLISNGLSPAPTMWWHDLIALHAAVLPLVLWGDALLRSRRVRLARRGLALVAVLALLLALSMALASDHYRPGGRDGNRKGPWSDRRLLARQHIEQPLDWEREQPFRIWRELGIPDEIPVTEPPEKPR